MKNKNRDVSEIGNRAKTILSEVIEVYLRQGTPVSSKSISEKLNSPLSPSSIRLVMARLEDQGYLHSPHTSSGRIPTDKGLKLFSWERWTSG